MNINFNSYKRFFFFYILSLSRFAMSQLHSVIRPNLRLKRFFSQLFTLFLSVVVSVSNIVVYILLVTVSVFSTKSCALLGFNSSFFLITISQFHFVFIFHRQWFFVSIIMVIIIIAGHEGAVAFTKISQYNTIFFIT